jgi:hypothetical protein
MALATSRHTSTIEAVEASGPGALPGFEVRCADCAEVARFSLPTLAAEHARGHQAFMAAREERAVRGRKCFCGMPKTKRYGTGGRPGCPYHG